MRREYEDLFKLIEKECKKNKVKLDIRDVSYVKINSSKCSGYFQSEKNDLKIVVAKKGIDEKHYRSTLLHEYCHLTQYLDNCKIWKKSQDSIIALHEWLGGKEFNKKDIKKHISNCRDLELNNDKRAVKFLDKYNIGISKKEYTKIANAHILSYNWLLEKRDWAKSGVSVNNDKLLSLMSDKFDMNYKKLSPKIRRVFKKEKI